MTSSNKPTDLSVLDTWTVGAFTAPTSGERASRLREWLLSNPSHEQLQEVYREMSGRDKGAAKVLKERLDEAKRAREQDLLVGEWSAKAEQLLGLTHLNIADAMAWQRDAAKAGAPLSREPLATLKVRLAEVVRRVEDLQHQVMVQREAAVLLAQRIEVLSTKALVEAQQAQAGLAVDVQAWNEQAHRLTQDVAWSSVDMKYPTQIESSRAQLQAVWDGFAAALQQASQALTQADAPLPPVPVWADEIRLSRGETLVPPVSAAPGKPKMDAAQRQALREQATQAVLQVLEAVEKEVTEGHGKASAGAAVALRQVLKEHGRHLDTALDARVHQALTAAGELEGWQRWRADQLRQELVSKAEALLGPDKTPVMGGRKMQEALRQMREAWKQTDQGGLPNHALWKRFDAACNEAYKTVQVWLDQVKQESAAQKSLRHQLIDEVKAWTLAHAEDSDWRTQVRTIHQFSERWRSAGHLSEKAYAELQPQWKAAIHGAALRLEAAQKESTQRRHAMIEEAKALGAAPALRIDAVKVLQQRWQAEAQAVPLDRKSEQKLWEAFRKPIDEAFQRKGAAREQAHQATLSPRDQAVLDASKALQAANASGEAHRIREAVAALNAALKFQQVQAAQADAPAATEPTESVAQGPVADTAAPKPARAVVAVRGDDRPGQKKTEPASSAKGPRRDGRPGERRDADRGWSRERDDRREDRGPRLADAAFRAQRDAREHAEQALRKLAAQAHGETLVRLMSAWKARQSEALPSAQELGKAVPAAIRSAWSQALGEPAQAAASQALLRLEMAAEVPTPAEHLADRRALQLQLLTRRNEASPSETWGQDVARVLAAGHDEASERRLQNALKQLLRR